MYGKRKVQNDIHTYRLSNSLQYKALIYSAFCVIVSLLFIWGNRQNHPGLSFDNLAIEIVIVSLNILFIINLYQMRYGFKLCLSTDGGEFQAKGYHIVFDWKDVKQIDYILQNKGKPYAQLSLKLKNCQILEDEFKIPFSYYFQPIVFYDNAIPIGNVYKWDFIGLNYNSPSKDELRNYLDYFITTQFGQDLLRFAPHLFHLPKDKFFKIQE